MLNFFPEKLDKWIGIFNYNWNYDCMFMSFDDKDDFESYLKTQNINEYQYIMIHADIIEIWSEELLGYVS